MKACAFWACLACLFYVYVGYPILIHVLSKLRPLARRKEPMFAPVSVVIACHNEVDHVVNKVLSLLGSPQGTLIAEILIGSDGSTDGTVEVLQVLGDPRVRVYDFSARRGKPAVLNDLIPQCSSEYVILCDARQEVSEQAIPKLLANFADDRVGAVSGELMFVHESSDSTARHGIGAYWRYEKLIRKAESRFRSVPGATGALYAIRKTLFRPISTNTLLDDVAIPMQAVVQGHLCVFESEAIAWDRPSRSLSHEAIRKRRTVAGAAQLLLHHPAWLLPWCNPIWFEYVSHKILRLASPLFLIVSAAAHVTLLDSRLYATLGVFHAGFYMAAAVGWLYQQTGRRSPLFALPLMFVTLNVTTLLALWDAARGRFQVTWRRAPVEPGPPDRSVVMNRSTPDDPVSEHRHSAEDSPIMPAQPSEW